MQRRLVKSPPELWAEVSDAEALGRHLDLFGEIRISRLEPESTVAWEGVRASGTVVLDSAGWGTKVTLTAEMRPPALPEDAQSEPVGTGGSAPLALSEEGTIGDTTPVAATEPAGGPAVASPDAAPGRAEPPSADVQRDPEPPARRGLFARLFRRQPPPVLAPEPLPEPEPVAEPVPPPVAAPVELVAAPVEPEPEPEPAAPELGAQEALTALEQVLDTLGAAHHRPFSR